ncbi:CCA tRNA nucleotidyltransferase, mitochondrial [Talaromyces marneffei ATCC 18224]
MDSTKEISYPEPPNKRVKLADQNINRLDAKMTPSITTQIDLSPAEQLLRTLLLDCRNHVATPRDSENGNNPNAGDMWFVGGWVRDKLLGNQSCDIDVAMSNMTGPEFASHLKDFLSSESRPAQPAELSTSEPDEKSKTQAQTKGDIYKQQATKAGLSTEIRGFYEIDRNPKKGKHLQTTSAKIFGLDIDFVNLRTETQELQVENLSRVGREFGSSAEEDAYRRDATVNAIFYNLDTQRVEDYTTKGLQDLEAKVLRTPLDARVTFTDDPLRILRFVRLASTLGFTIDEGDTQQAMKSPEIQSLIGTRISPERIGLELKKMVTGPDPVTALLWIHRLKLYKHVFLGEQQKGVLDRLAESKASEKKGWASDKEEYVWPLAWPDACKTVSELLSSHNNRLVATELAQSQDLELVWQMALWCSLALLCRPQDTHPFPVVKPAINAIKPTNEKSKLLESSLSNMHEIRSTIDRVVESKDKGSLRRSTIGTAIRSWGKTWRLQVLFTLLTDILSDKSRTKGLIDRYSAFLQFIIDQKLQDAPSMKQILTGGDIKTLFQLRRSGPFMNSVMKAALEWQLDHEADYENDDELREKAIEWLRGQKEQLKIPDPD